MTAVSSADRLTIQQRVSLYDNISPVYVTIDEWQRHLTAGHAMMPR